VGKQTRRLGRGMSSLLSGELAAGDVGRFATAPGTTPATREIPIHCILPNALQPRTQVDPKHLEELARSIQTSGVIQPVVVRPRDGNYELVTGERRWRAAQKAGLTTMPAVVREVTDQQMLEFALVENIQREDLNPMDRALAYRHCCERFDLTPDVLAEHLGEDRSTVANYLRLLDLPEPVQQLVRDASLSMGHARCLLGLPDAEAMERVAAEAVDAGHSVRRLEQLVREYKRQPDDGLAKPPRTPPPKRPLIQDLEQRFSQTLQTRVTINEGRKRHTGKLVVEYYTLDDFDRIADRLGVKLDDF